jgi:hypothetical protein
MPAIYDLKRNENGKIGFVVVLSSVAPFNQNDFAKIQKSFGKVNFDVNWPILNLTANQMRDAVKEYATSHDFSKYSCFACVIVSRSGSGGQILGIDGEPVHLIKELVRPFDSCASLKGKPKLFFVDKHDRSGLVENEIEHKPHDEYEVATASDAIYVDTMNDLNRTWKERRYASQQYEDVLVYYSSAENGRCFKDGSLENSIFILCLSAVFFNYGQACVNVELNTLLVEVNERVAARTRQMQIPVIFNRLKKAFYLKADLIALVKPNR